MAYAIVDQTRVNVKYDSDNNKQYTYKLLRKMQPASGLPLGQGTDGPWAFSGHPRFFHLLYIFTPPGSQEQHHLTRKLYCNKTVAAQLQIGGQVPNIDGVTWTVEGFSGEKRRAV